MFRAAVAGIALVTASLSCGRRHPGELDAGTDAVTTDAGCAPGDLTCFIVDCGAKNLPPTSLKGTVYAPNGTLPLYGVNVYVPAADPGALPLGVTCDRCTDGLLGASIVATTTDEAGNFELDNVPATTNVPLVIQVGKWRRQLVLPNVAACQATPAAIADTTLPKSRTDASPLTAIDATTGAPKVDLPYIAVTTGSYDALECLILKLGIDPKEITNDVGGGHVRWFTNAGAAPAGQGAEVFEAGWPRRRWLGIRRRDRAVVDDDDASRRTTS